MNLSKRIKNLEKIINTNKEDEFFERNSKEGGLLYVLAPDMDWIAFKQRHEDTSGIGLLCALLDELRAEEQAG